MNKFKIFGGAAIVLFVACDISTKVHATRSNVAHKQDFDLSRCIGKHHCSDTHSYNEAVFVLNHCPNTYMDGDHDGIPCEGQYQTEISSRY